MLTPHRFALVLFLMTAGCFSWAEEPPFREFILSSSSAELEMEFPSDLWVVVMETGLENGSYCMMVAIVGGAVRIDSCGFGALVRASSDSLVGAASEKLFSAASKSMAAFSVVDSPSVRPAVGTTVFYVRQGEALLKGESQEQYLRDGRHPLSGLFQAASDLIVATRQQVFIGHD